MISTWCYLRETYTIEEDHRRLLENQEVERLERFEMIENHEYEHLFQACKSKIIIVGAYTIAKKSINSIKNDKEK